MGHILEQLKTVVGKPVRDHTPSPMGAWLDGILESAEEGQLSVSYLVRSEMTNPAGILHGGAVATMLDDIMGMTVYSLGRDAFFATINLSLDFLGTAKVGEKVIARSQVVKAGRSVVFMAAQLENESGKVLAKSSSNLVNSSYSYTKEKPNEL